MPRGIYKRKGRKAKKGGKVFLASKDTMRAMRLMGEASEPPTQKYVVEIVQQRRIAVYVNAKDVSEATFLANEFVHRNKKIVGKVVLPGVGVTSMKCETRGVEVTNEMSLDPESEFAKAFESPIQKVWAKQRQKKKSSEFVDAPRPAHYKIVAVRAK